MTILFSPPPPPPEDKRALGLMMRLGARDRWSGFVNSDGLVGLYSHYDDHQSTPCLMGADACRWCTLGRARRYRAYVGYYNLAVKRHHVLELTEAAATALQAGLAGPAALTLRGLWLELERQPATIRGRVTVRWDPTHRAAFRLPDPLDVERIVSRIYES